MPMTALPRRALPRSTLPRPALPRPAAPCPDLLRVATLAAAAPLALAVPAFAQTADINRWVIEADEARTVARTDAFDITKNQLFTAVLQTAGIKAPNCPGLMSDGSAADPATSPLTTN